MELQKSHRPISKSSSTSKLYFNSLTQKKNSTNFFPEQNYFFSQKFENLHEMNKKRTGFLFSKNEEKRQILRKKINSFSNKIVLLIAQ